MTVKGNSCPRGAKYGIAEVTNPVRVVTSTVKITGAECARLPVKTDKPISKKKIFDVIKLLDNIEVASPIKIGDIIISNILGTDVNIVATKNM
jgi:CxxC motif-containing protein